MTVHTIVIGDSDLYDDVYAVWEAEFEGKTGPAVRAPEDVRYLERVVDRLNENVADFAVVIVNQRAKLNKTEKGEPDLATMTERLGVLQQRYPRTRIVLCLYEEPRFQQMIALHAARLALVLLNDARMIREYLLQLIRDAVRDALTYDAEDAATGHPSAKTKEEAPPELEVIAEFRFHIPDPELRLHMFYGGLPLTAKSVPIRGDTVLMQRFLDSSNEVDKIAKEPPSVATQGKLLSAMITLDEVGTQIMASGDMITEYERLANERIAKLVRFRITTSAERYPCLFEALRIGARPRPVVLEHPTYRSVFFGQDPRLQLEWSHSNPVNILVVVANVPASPLTVVSEKEQLSVSFKPLPFVEEEAKLFNRLKRAYDHGEPLDRADGELGEPVKVAVGRVDILRYEHNKPLLSKRLKKALTESQYDIVHFIGHTYGHPLPNNTIDTRLVLPTGDPTAAEALTLFQLTTWLKKSKVQFVYLSCCSGIPTAGGAGVTLTSAAVAQLFRSIPVTLGFRWDVFDERAFEFAEDFYTELFVHACDFDEAMQRARLNLYDPASGSEPMWVSPVLLLQ
ncbi:CHAT domain-containing protein [Sinorhizobium meliloti]|uniref:CHAT domain-containing protein n=1 Tax=Rhizobium meliloti TaxID=382 RepID=UPI00030D9C77|nr:CHAT domain-containing protein [Sinorhizobium meliloti]UDU21351.1 CHAT domain-containing protein [Sinorhizobium meliloti]